MSGSIEKSATRGFLRLLGTTHAWNLERKENRNYPINHWFHNVASCLGYYKAAVDVAWTPDGWQLTPENKEAKIVLQYIRDVEAEDEISNG